MSMTWDWFSFYLITKSTGYLSIHLHKMMNRWRWWGWWYYQDKDQDVVIHEHQEEDEKKKSLLITEIFLVNPKLLGFELISWFCWYVDLVQSFTLFSIKVELLNISVNCRVSSTITVSLSTHLLKSLLSLLSLSSQNIIRIISWASLASV